MKNLSINKISRAMSVYYGKDIKYSVGFQGETKEFFKTKQEALKRACDIMKDLDPNTYRFEDRTLR